jgi:hypothetical protein
VISGTEFRKHQLETEQEEGMLWRKEKLREKELRAMGYLDADLDGPDVPAVSLPPPPPLPKGSISPPGAVLAMSTMQANNLSRVRPDPIPPPLVRG